MEIYNLNSNRFIDLINHIKTNFKQTNVYINNLNNKNNDIKKIISKFSSKKTLKVISCITNLQFQSQLLENELSYTLKTNDIILKQLYKSIYELAENVIMIASSLDNINEEYDTTNKTQNLLNKISPIKRVDKQFNIDIVITLVNSLVNNLKIIQSILEHFDNYINKTDIKMQEGNYHCKNLKFILSNQKNHLVLEYNNYCNCLEGYLDYYNDISSKMIEQLNNQSLTHFLGSNNKTENNNTPNESEVLVKEEITTDINTNENQEDTTNETINN